MAGNYDWAGMEMREAYVRALIDANRERGDIVVVEADLAVPHGTPAFAKEFPGRLVNCGIAEANAVGVAAGLAATGLRPFVNLFACFASRRAFDQFFVSCCYAGQGVRLIGSDQGVLAQKNGGTHCSFEDIAMMRTVPGLVVVEPSDVVSLYALVRALADHPGPSYIRLHRKGGHVAYPARERFEIGKGKVMADGGDVTIVSAGLLMLKEALRAKDMLAEKGVSAAVLDMLTISPLDEELVLKYAAKTKGLVVCENASARGGLGGAVAELLSEKMPRRVERIGARTFGEVGNADYLLERLGMSANHIAAAALAIVGK